MQVLAVCMHPSRVHACKCWPSPGPTCPGPQQLGRGRGGGLSRLRCPWCLRWSCTLLGSCSARGLSCVFWNAAALCSFVAMLYWSCQHQQHRGIGDVGSSSSGGGGESNNKQQHAAAERSSGKQQAAASREQTTTKAVEGVIVNGEITAT